MIHENTPLRTGLLNVVAAVWIPSVGSALSHRRVRRRHKAILRGPSAAAALATDLIGEDVIRVTYVPR